MIASDVDGTREAVENGVNGFLVPASNPQAMADAILKVAGDPSLRETISRNAIRTIREKFDVASMTKEIELVYEQLGK